MLKTLWDYTGGWFVGSSTTASTQTATTTATTATAIEATPTPETSATTLTTTLAETTPTVANVTEGKASAPVSMELCACKSGSTCSRCFGDESKRSNPLVAKTATTTTEATTPAPKPETSATTLAIPLPETTPVAKATEEKASAPVSVELCACKSGSTCSCCFGNESKRSNPFVAKTAEQTTEQTPVSPQSSSHSLIQQKMEATKVGSETKLVTEKPLVKKPAAKAPVEAKKVETLAEIDPFPPLKPSSGPVPTDRAGQSAYAKRKPVKPNLNTRPPRVWAEVASSQRPLLGNPGNIQQLRERQNPGTASATTETAVDQVRPGYARNRY
jgi:hypothetical protein